jgi:hypothetical protein
MGMNPKSNVVRYFQVHMHSPEDDICVILQKQLHEAFSLIWGYRLQSVKEIELMRKLTKLGNIPPAAKLRALQLMK